MLGSHYRSGWLSTILAGGVLASVAVHRADAQCTTYIVTPVGHPGWWDSEATGINDEGVVVGWAYVTLFQERVFRWTPKAGTTLLPIPDDALHAHGGTINQQGVVTGYSWGTPDGNSRALRWTTEGMIEHLPLPKNVPHSVAYSTSATGTTVGFAESLGAVVWNGASITPLGPVSSSAFGINDSGVIVGHASLVPGGQYLATRWVPGQGSHTLGSLGGASAAYFISNNGLIVGESALTNSATSPRHAVIWDGELMIDLHGDTTLHSTVAYQVNGSGMVVGCSTGTAPNHGLMWDADGQMHMLSNRLHSSSREWAITRAYGINNHGVIVGAGNRPGYSGAVLLTPVTESTADLNCDGVVDVLDLLILLSAWGPCSTAQRTLCSADLNNSGAVDVADLLILLANWG